MIKKIIILILFLLITSNCFAYTLKLRTIYEEITYKNVYRHKIDDDFLKIYIYDGFNNIKVLVKKAYIITIEILED